MSRAGRLQMVFILASGQIPLAFMLEREPGGHHGAPAVCLKGLDGFGRKNGEA